MVQIKKNYEDVLLFFTGESNQLELDGPMLLGGMGPPFSDITAPPTLWTAVLKQGFVGCLLDLNVNNRPIDVAGFARQQDSGRNILVLLYST